MYIYLDLTKFDRKFSNFAEVAPTHEHFIAAIVWRWIGRRTANLMFDNME
jgi:hypothetical protein